MHAVGGKRPFEGLIESEAPTPKRAAPNKDEESFRFCKWGETEIPINVVSRIVSFLPKRELFKFPALAKGAGAFTEDRFKQIKQQKRLDFCFPGDEKRSYPERASYISICVLMKYLDKREALIKNQNMLQVQVVPSRPPEAKIKELYQEFRGIMRHLPCSLGRFIWKDLNNMALLQSQDEKLFLEEPPSQTSEHASPASLAGGELLKGLSHLTTYCDLTWKGNLNQVFLSLGKALPHLESAMRSGAAVASCFAIKILSPLSSATNDYCKDLAIASASHKDYRGLELLLEKNIIDAVQVYQAGRHYPPIVGVIGIKKCGGVEPDLKKIQLFFKEAIEGYENPSSIPVSFWVCAGIVERKLGNYEKAEEYLERALEQKNSLLDLERMRLSIHLMYAKIGLEKWEEAEKWSIEVCIANFLLGQPLPINLYEDFALIKAKRNKWEEANFYLDRAISNSTGPRQYYTWFTAARIKMLDERYEEAEQFMQKFLDSANSIPAGSLARMAKIKFHLKKLPEAKTYMDKALAAYQDQVPPDVQEMANQIQAQYSLSNSE